MKIQRHYSGISLLLAVLFCLTGTVHAQTYQEGRAAYIQGDYQAAYNILRPLADAGDANAQKMMGIMYDYGQGVGADPETALEWYIRSAEQGQTAVQYQVGAKYFKGETIPRDYDAAAKWWRMAADGGQVDAQFNLGLMYFRGLGLTQDDNMAANMFGLAAEQGHGHAQYSLGVMYAFGRGVQRDYDQAREWFLKSADQGIAQAQYNLGIFYENGNGVEADTEQARDWYQLAAVQGLNEAILKLEQMDEVESDLAETTTTTTSGVSSASADESPARSYSFDEISTNAIKRENWLMQQNADYYTIQIGSLVNEEDMVKYIKSNGIEENSAYIELVINGVTRYNGLYGIYDTYQDAETAIPDLPGPIRRVNPWIRNIGILQNLLQ